MSGSRRIVTEAQQAFSFSRRSFVLGAAQIGVGTILAGRMAWLSIAQNEKYALLSESNRVNLTLVPPRRGWIVDRAGRPLALNRTTFRVDLIPDRLANKAQVLAELQKLLSLDVLEMDRITEELSKAAGFQPVVVAENLDYERFAAVSVRAPQMPGVAPAQSFARFYPEGAGVGHLLGYVGAASAEDYQKTRDPLLITPGFKIGKSGLEQVMDAPMRGLPGAKRTEVTASGKLVRDLATKQDVSGSAIKLTVDAGLQAYAARRLGNESGSVVVFDCLTGGILTMVSMPSFDPNSFSDGIGRMEWKMLREDDHVPLLNKVLQGLYPPGSTLKPMVALALLRHGVNPDETVYCGGGYTLGGRRFNCLGHHGSINMPNAIMKSCNTYFYTMGNRIGYDNIAPMARELGLGQEFDLPFPSQRYGTVPDSKWKLKKYKQEWSRADTLNATIGQGYVLVSPFQLALMSARIASGRALVPHLFLGKHPPAPPLAIPPEHLAIVHEGMNRVVNSAGTGARSRLQLPDVKMAGKTGTAQVRQISGSRRGQDGVWKYRDHGLFVCFAPVDQPRYAAAVVIDHGLGGARAAAPVAKDILTYLYDPEQAMATLRSLESGWGGDIHQRMERKRNAWMAANDPASAAARAEAEAAAAAANAADDGNEAAPNSAGNAAEAETEKPKAPDKPPEKMPPKPAKPPVEISPPPAPEPITPPQAPPPTLPQSPFPAGPAPAGPLSAVPRP
jgi:penicillin-binding protein 2